MTDPFTEVVTLLQPVMRFSKVVEAASPWRVRRATTGEPFYCAVLEGSSRLIMKATIRWCSTRVTLSWCLRPSTSRPRALVHREPIISRQ